MDRVADRGGSEGYPCLGSISCTISLEFALARQHTRTPRIVRSHDLLVVVFVISSNVWSQVSGRNYKGIPKRECQLVNYVFNNDGITFLSF